MKKIYTIFLTLCFIITINAQNWINRPITGLTTSSKQIAAMTVCDSSTAVVGGHYNSKVYITTDNGLNWETKDISSSTGDTITGTIDISAIDKNHFWIGTDKGQILYTGDGGTNWTVQFYDTNTTKFIDYIKMFDSNNGVAVGDPHFSSSLQTVILKTTNGGTSWNSVNTQIFGIDGDIYRRVSFPDKNTGYFFESLVNPQKLFKTTDGGATWDTTNFSSVSTYLTTIKFFNKDIGIADNLGKICYTLDGGQSWDTTRIDDDSWGMDLEFVEDNNALYVALAKDGGIYFSADTGKTWKADTTLKGKDVRNLSFFNKDRGWALAVDGGPYFNDINVTDIKNNNSVQPKTFMLSQNYPNPFNPSTVIRYNILQNGIVTLKIFDTLGREVKTLINTEQAAGQHEINFNAGNLPSGIYFYRITAGNYSAVKKMILLK